MTNRDITGGHSTGADLIETAVGNNGRKIAAGSGIDQTNTGDVNVTFNHADELDRTPVRLALLEYNLGRTQRSQDIWSYAVIAVAALCIVIVFGIMKAYNDLRTDILTQNNRMEQRIIRLEDKVEHIQQQLDGRTFYLSPSETSQERQ